MVEGIYSDERRRYRYYPSSYAAWVINWVIGIIEAMLTLRLVLELLGASGSSQFVGWVYGITAGFVAPFSGAFPSMSFGSFSLDISTIFAMIGYAIIGWLLVRVFSFVFTALERV
jgi:YggT family protein